MRFFGDTSEIFWISYQSNENSPFFNVLYRRNYASERKVVIDFFVAWLVFFIFCIDCLAQKRKGNVLGAENEKKGRIFAIFSNFHNVPSRNFVGKPQIRIQHPKKHTDSEKYLLPQNFPKMALF